MARELLKTITIDGDEYIIQRFDAMTGLCLARLVLAKAAPIIAIIGEDGNTTDQVVQAIGALGDSISDEDINSLVTKCLRYCYKRLPAGNQPIIDADGHFGVEDVQYDMFLTLQLCFEALKFGASDFFGEKGSTLKDKILSAFNRSNQSTTTPISSPLS